MRSGGHRGWAYTLRNDLKRVRIKEIGDRMTVFALVACAIGGETLSPWCCAPRCRQGSNRIRYLPRRPGSCSPSRSSPRSRPAVILCARSRPGSKPAKIRQMVRGGLDPAHARELTDDMRPAGLPFRPACSRSSTAQWVFRVRRTKCDLRPDQRASTDRQRLKQSEPQTDLHYSSGRYSLRAATASLSPYARFHQPALSLCPRRHFTLS